MTLIVIGIFFATLFATALLSKRRFGTLGLALAAGALLANYASRDTAQLLTALDIPVSPFSETTAAAILLILLPALVLLFSGPSYVSRQQSILGALLFASMALLLLLRPLSTGLDTEPFRDILQLVARYTNLLLALFISLAVADAWLTHNIKPSDKSKK